MTNAEARFNIALRPQGRGERGGGGGEGGMEVGEEGDYIPVVALSPPE